MPSGAPPVEVATDLCHYTIPSGSLLWRAMSRNSLHSATLFTTRMAPGDDELNNSEIAPYGRFDATTDDPFGFCYAASDDLTAIAETLLRDVSFASRVRAIPRREVDGRTLVVYETLRPLKLVALTTSAELARARQDPWLVQADPDEYAYTRRWGQWLRRSSPDAHGFTWPSRRNPGGRCFVLFADRGSGERVSLVPVLSRDLDGGSGLEWLNRRLEDLNTVVDDSSWEEGGDRG